MKKDSEPVGEQPGSQETKGEETVKPMKKKKKVKQIRRVKRKKLVKKDEKEKDMDKKNESIPTLGGDNTIELDN